MNECATPGTQTGNHANKNIATEKESTKPCAVKIECKPKARTDVAVESSGSTEWKNFPKEIAKDVSAKPSGCPFSGKKELRTVRLKNYVTTDQAIDNLHLTAKVNKLLFPLLAFCGFTF